MEPEGACSGAGCLAGWLQVRGNDMEFRAYGLLYAAVTTPKQLAMELREVPEQAWGHPYMQHALQARMHAHASHARMSRKAAVICYVFRRLAQQQVQVHALAQAGQSLPVLRQWRCAGCTMADSEPNGCALLLCQCCRNARELCCACRCAWPRSGRTRSSCWTCMPARHAWRPT